MAVADSLCKIKSQPTQDSLDSYKQRPRRSYCWCYIERRRCLYFFGYRSAWLAIWGGLNGLFLKSNLIVKLRSSEENKANYGRPVR